MVECTQYDVQTDAMKGGSDVRFRVEATDALIPDLMKPMKPLPFRPCTQCVRPESNRQSVVPPGGLLVLQGSANDFEDGTLPDESLAWTDDVQGGLGIGPSVALNTLTPVNISSP